MALNVLVTGAGGYIGRHVVTSLLDMGHKVTALDFVTAGIDERADVQTIDIFKENKGLFARIGNPDVMIHMAWKDGFKHNSPAHMQFLSAHYEFVMSMVEQGLKQVLVMGSMHEVGYFEGEINEDTPTNPRSQYGVAKDALRRALTMSLSGTDTILQWVRAYYILGDDARNNSVFAKLIEAEQAGKTKFPFTTGVNQYDFIHVDDLAKMIAATTSQTEVTGVINCCSGKPQALKDVVEAFIKEKGFKIELEYGAFPDRPYDSPIVYGNADKITKILENLK